MKQGPTRKRVFAAAKACDEIGTHGIHLGSVTLFVSVKGSEKEAHPTGFEPVTVRLEERHSFRN
jgi:hypothetical protein